MKDLPGTDLELEMEQSLASLLEKRNINFKLDEKVKKKKPSKTYKHLVTKSSKYKQWSKEEGEHGF